MVIDAILDRQAGVPYNPDDFYNYLMDESKVCNGMFDSVIDEMDFGTNEFVQYELNNYIRSQGYNPEICDYVNSVDWLHADKPKPENEPVVFFKYEWNTNDLANALEVQNREPTAENVQKLLAYFQNKRHLGDFEETMIQTGFEIIYSIIDEVIPYEEEARA